MARKATRQTQAEPDDFDDALAEAEAGADTGDSPPDGPDAAALPARWRVTLACPTPLTHPTLVVEAASREAARAKYCEANGMSDSVHEWKIDRVKE